MEFTVDESENSELGRLLLSRLVEHNLSQVPPSERKAFMIAAQSEGGNLKGGVQGHTHWGWMFVAHLWVDEEFRGRGLGLDLMRRAEDLARTRNCARVWLDTFSFQALGFYEKQGYRKFGELADFPKGHSRYFLVKNL